MGKGGRERSSEESMQIALKHNFELKRKVVCGNLTGVLNAEWNVSYLVIFFLSAAECLSAAEQCSMIMSTKR